MQLATVAEAHGGGDAVRSRIAAEGEVGHFQSGAMMGGQQGCQGGVAVRVSAAPVVAGAGAVGVGLRVHAVDDQHPAVVLAEERSVVGERRKGDAAGLVDFVLLRPVVDDAFVRRVRLGVAKTGGVPTAARLHGDEQLAWVVRGTNDGHAKARATQSEGSLDDVASVHFGFVCRERLEMEIAVVHEHGGQHHAPCLHHPHLFFGCREAIQKTA